MTKKLAILGSTGSIGTQALEVIEQNPEEFQIEVLTANSNYELLAEQAITYNANCVVIANDKHYAKLKTLLSEYSIKVYAGNDAISQVCSMDEVDTVLTALVGAAGLLPTIEAIKSKKNIALANKETLVVAGELITKLALEYNTPILPVDSEHSAIFQCLYGEWQNPIEKIILTASGGPFRGRKKNELIGVAAGQALAHPNWEMGAKITIDSATLMNKGLEVIEAKWLFDLKPEQIEVVVHPQSIIHSMVQFRDGSIKAQMGQPDMKLPIQVALSYPKRSTNNWPRFNFMDNPSLTFEKPDIETFECLGLAFEALKIGGTASCSLNAANEISVQAFLDGKIDFLSIARINKICLEKFDHQKSPDLNTLLDVDKEARAMARSYIA